MIKTMLCIAIGSTLLTAAAPVPVDSKASADLKALGDDYWEAVMRSDPLGATFAHHPGYDDKLEDVTPSGVARSVAELESLRGRLKGIPVSGLGDSERVSLEILELLIDQRLGRYERGFRFWEIDHRDGPHARIPSFVAEYQPMRTEADAAALLARLKAIPPFFAAHVSNLREGIRLGRTAPRPPVAKTISQLEEMLKTPAADSPFAAAARRLPADLQSKFLPLIAASVSADVTPALRTYKDFLKDEYLAKSREVKIGLSALPGGAADYRYLIRYYTTLDKDPAALHAEGLRLTKGIRAEMEKLARKMGKADLDSFIREVKGDPKNYFSTREEVLADAQSKIARLEGKLPLFFSRLPKTPLVIKPFEDFKEKNAVMAGYNAPPADLSGPGIYYVNTYQPGTRARFAMMALAAHEGVPGHHLQMSLAAEDRGLPVFRRKWSCVAYVEGWGLYAERLADEMGMYDDDLSRLGMLSYQAWRASRLVVDTGIHSLGWSRQQAIDFIKRNTLLSDQEIQAEVDRYIAYPGQALSYMTGQQEFMAIRRESQKRLGAGFDLRSFHDSVLRNGPVPLRLLHRTILGD
ncbi:MAG: DUF885 domain-containing protein [Elusimicrobia bacterium]|nr:DUF885 domain-containing protein [Elusimicrobiota bacterium]